LREALPPGDLGVGGRQRHLQLEGGQLLHQGPGLAQVRRPLEPARLRQHLQGADQLRLGHPPAALVAGRLELVLTRRVLARQLARAGLLEPSSREHAEAVTPFTDAISGTYSELWIAAAAANWLGAHSAREDLVEARVGAEFPPVAPTPPPSPPDKDAYR